MQANAENCQLDQRKENTQAGSGTASYQANANRTFNAFEVPLVLFCCDTVDLPIY